MSAYLEEPKGVFSDGYGPWIIVSGVRPPEVTNLDSVRYRTFSDTVIPDEWYAMTLRWGTAKAIRLKSFHPLYIKLAAQTAQNPPQVPTEDPLVAKIRKKWPGLIEQLAKDL